MVAVSAATRPASSPAGSTSSTRPIRSARSAFTSSLVNSRCLAADGPTSAASRRVVGAG